MFCIHNCVLFFQGSSDFKITYVSACYLHFVHHNPVFQKLARWSSVAPIRPRSTEALHLRMGTDPVLKSSVPFGILDTGHKSKNIIISSVTQYYENPLQLKYLSIRFLSFCLLSSQYKMLKREMNSAVHIETPPQWCATCVLLCMMYVCCTYVSEVIHVLTAD